MKLKIDKLVKRPSKKYQGKFNISILCNGTWYSAFGGQWNSHWVEGSTIEIEESQITKNEQNGTVYNNISAPQTAKLNSISPNTDKQFVKIISLLEEILKYVKTAPKESFPDYGALTDDGPPPTDDLILQPDDTPF